MTCPDRSNPHLAAPGGGAQAVAPGPVRLGIVLLGAAVLVVGCGEPVGRSTPALTRDEFIDVVVAIRRAELDLERTGLEGDTVATRFQARRDSILAAHGTTGEQLNEFLEHHTDLDFMDGVWDSITQGLKRPLRSRELPPELEEDAAESKGWPPTRRGDEGRPRLRSGG